MKLLFVLLNQPPSVGCDRISFTNPMFDIFFSILILKIPIPLLYWLYLSLFILISS